MRLGSAQIQGEAIHEKEYVPEFRESSDPWIECPVESIVVDRVEGPFSKRKNPVT
jgi:hypothetical protein